MRRARVVICAVVIGGALLVGSIGALAAQSGGRPRANQAAARRAARQLLTQLQLPTDATRSPIEPRGDGRVLRPPATTARNAVSFNAWWTSSNSSAALLAYVKAHRPAGGGYYQLITESTPRATTVIFSWILDGAQLYSRQLQITFARLADGRTGILAEAQSAWMVPRPPSERIPGGVHSVVITLRIGDGQSGISNQHTHRYLITDPAKVASVVHELDSLPILQPGLFYNCPATFAGRPQLTTLFTSRSGATLAKAQVDVYPGRHGTSGWNNCDPVTFWIEGNPQTPLTSHTFVSWLGMLVGANIS